MLRSKKVGALPVEGSDEQKRNNEIGMAIPLLETCDIAGKDITGDALLTQRAIAAHIVQQHAHYHFTVKGNQPTLESDIALVFKDHGAPDYTEVSPPEHGRIETRRIWCSVELNDYLDFPHVGQVFLIIIDWNYDEDRSRIRTGFGPENVTRLRRFAIGVLRSFQKARQSIATMMRNLAFNTRLVFDYLRMTQNSIARSCA